MPCHGPPGPASGSPGGQHVAERRILRIVTAKEPDLAIPAKRPAEHVHQFPHFLESAADRHGAAFAGKAVFAILPSVGAKRAKPGGLARRKETVFFAVVPP